MVQFLLLLDVQFTTSPTLQLVLLPLLQLNDYSTILLLFLLFLLLLPPQPHPCTLNSYIY
jgi:hypothetical protein